MGQTKATSQYGQLREGLSETKKKCDIGQALPPHWQGNDAMREGKISNGGGGRMLLGDQQLPYRSDYWKGSFKMLF